MQNRYIGSRVSVLRSALMALAVLVAAGCSGPGGEPVAPPEDVQAPSAVERPGEQEPRILTYSFQRHRDALGYIPARSMHLLVPMRHFEVTGRLVVGGGPDRCAMLVVDEDHRLNVVWPESSAVWNEDGSTIEVSGLGGGDEAAPVVVADGDLVDVYGFHLVESDDPEFSPTMGRPALFEFLNEPGDAVCDGRYGVIAELAIHIPEPPRSHDRPPTPTPPLSSG